MGSFFFVCSNDNNNIGGKTTFSPTRKKNGLKAFCNFHTSATTTKYLKKYNETHIRDMCVCVELLSLAYD